MSFVPIYNETEYTMLASSIKLTELIAKAKEYQYPALAITDLNNMHGVLKFYQLCLDHQIKPIIGLHITLSSSMNFFNSLLVYAKSAVGYKNLLILSSRARINGFVEMDFLKKHSYDVLAVIPSDENEIVKLIREKSIEKAQRILEEYRQTFSDFYLGCDMQTDASRLLLPEVVAFGVSHRIPLVAIHKTSYLSVSDFDAYQVLRCIDLGLNQYLYSEKETAQNFLSPDTAQDLFRDYPELLENTLAIVAKCNVTLSFGKFRLPVFPDAKGKSIEYLTELCKLGLNKRLKNRNGDYVAYKKRLIYELGIIGQMGFADYFLIVYDYVKYAKKNHILVGPGRGSAPSSLVSYVLGITDLDPLEYDLLFERFLNPERITMPDIDVDFPDNRRDEVIQYVVSKYGKGRIAHISAFGTFGVRLAVRDVARVMKMNDVTVNEILKFVSDPNQSMESIVQENERFRDLMDSNPQVRNLVMIVRKIEGLPRHISTHAAGIIMADDELVNYTALQPGLNGVYQTQYEAPDLEKIGLVKMDFLGLRNLTIIDEVVRNIKAENPDFDIGSIPMDDKFTYHMIASGDTDGIFQLESQGMRNVLMKLKTSEFMDIVHANALYRPGPMEIIPSFIRRKFRLEPVDTIHPDLKEILEPTFGLIVFQEQIMLIAQKFAGYTLGMADILRRAVSKKSAETLIRERERFVKSAAGKGYDEAISNKVYDYIVKFANYGFNKSHSVAYSLIAYQMAYLKRRYYRYFMSVLMTNSIGSISLIRNYIADCSKKKVTVRGPSINCSDDTFTVRDGDIYYSLLGIQNVGALTLKNLLEERSAHGIYQSYDEFITRTKDILNKRVVESLILAGALDEFGIPRKQMVLEYDNSLSRASFSGVLQEGLIRRDYSDEEYSYEEISEHEREMLGFNLKYSLFAKYRDYMVKNGITEIANVKTGTGIRLLFAIKTIKAIKTKKDEDMAFVTIYDDTEEIDGVMFPKTYAGYRNELTLNAIYLGEGNIEMRNNKKQYIFNKLKSIK